MKTDFLSAVQRGDIEQIKTLIREASEKGIHTFFYQSILISSKPNQRSEKIYFVEYKDNLSKQSLLREIAFKIPSIDDYISSRFTSIVTLSPTELDQNTIDAALNIAITHKDSKITELLLKGGFDKPVTTILRGRDRNLSLKKFYTHYPNLTPCYYRFNYTAANPNIQHNNRTLLSLAAQNNDNACAKLLLQFGAQSDSQDKTTIDFCGPLLEQVLKIATPLQREKLKTNWEKHFPKLFADPFARLLKLTQTLSLSAYDYFKSSAYYVAEWLTWGNSHANQNITNNFDSLSGVYATTSSYHFSADETPFVSPLAPPKTVQNTAQSNTLDSKARLITPNPANALPHDRTRTTSGMTLVG